MRRCVGCNAAREEEKKEKNENKKKKKREERRRSTIIGVLLIGTISYRILLSRGLKKWGSFRCGSLSRGGGVEFCQRFRHRNTGGGSLRTQQDKNWIFVQREIRNNLKLKFGRSWWWRRWCCCCYCVEIRLKSIILVCPLQYIMILLWSIFQLHHDAHQMISNVVSTSLQGTWWFIIGLWGSGAAGGYFSVLIISFDCKHYFILCPFGQFSGTARVTTNRENKDVFTTLTVDDRAAIMDPSGWCQALPT